MSIVDNIICSSSPSDNTSFLNLNMKFAVLFLAMVAAAYAIPQDVVRRTEVRDLHGQFTLDYLSADGTKVTEHGRLVPNADGSDSVLVKEGVISYTSPEGIPFTLTYVADENGFRPVGDHIPQ